MRPDLESKIDKVGEVLCEEGRPLKERFRALFTLRNIGGEQSIAWIEKCFQDPSALLKHELAYCLGQMGDPRALPLLTRILTDLDQHPMVRHEAGEAIGAIGCESSIELLKEFTSDKSQEVAETCQLALRRIEWVKNEGNPNNKSIYFSVDPAPASDKRSIEELRSTLLNDKEDLFERYKAMFALRNLNTPESITTLCEGLFCGSALFRHEVAFVLGQIQSEHSVESLIKALEDKSQNEMVRHECAEALGSIATTKCMDILQLYQKDESRVVRESCDIALDMADYEMSSEFQYANTAAVVF